MTIIDTRTQLAPTATPRPTTQRLVRTRHYVMCTPSHFAVVYAINPWMDPSVPVDAERAHELAQARVVVTDENRRRVGECSGLLL